MSSIGEEPSSGYIRNESKRHNINNNVSITKIEEGNPEYSEVDNAKDNDIAQRCPVYMTGLKCHKGEYCEKLHRFPREDEVVCKYFKDEGCQRPASDCWFWHPGEKVDKFVPDDDAPLLVQSMGDLIKYVRREQAQNPDKYKCRIEPWIVFQKRK